MNISPRRVCYPRRQDVGGEGAVLSSMIRMSWRRRNMWQGYRLPELDILREEKMGYRGLSLTRIGKDHGRIF